MTNKKVDYLPGWVAEWDVVRVRDQSLWQRLTAPQLFLGSFLVLIALGTVGLRLLPGLYTGEPLSWLNALFTATSAVCVTGLTVVDTASYFTLRGQAFVLLLIQLGGLGIITFSTLIILALRRRLSLRHERLSASPVEVAPHVDQQKLTRSVVTFTLVIEAIGAVLLFLVWLPRFGWSALWPAVFHSVSAFCNAGFSTFSDSLMSFQRSPFTLLIIMTLIVLGGLGFLTLEELHLRRRPAGNGQRIRLSLHSKLALITTAVLLIAGWILYTIFEWHVTLGDMPIWARGLNGLFMSVTARTAGFNSIDYAATEPNTSFLTILLMAIGGSPGSTAGGLKTTTIALLALLAWSRLRGDEITSAWGRSVPLETVQRAIGLFVIGFVVLTAAIFGYVTLELHNVAPGANAHSFLDYMFEATSAFNTVGLSMGVTADLQPSARWLTILLMYVGRVGPLTFAAALTLAPGVRAGRFRFAYEDVIVG